MKLRFFWLISCLVAALSSLQAQEVKATVTIQTPNLRLVDPRTFKVLETNLREFINGRKWTDDNFKPEERLDCSFLITIMNEISSSRFSAQITVQSNRPVFNSSYRTTLLNYQDKSFEFEYVEGQNIDFNENNYTSDLSSVVAYYVYMMLGMDYDSFAMQGGTPFFQKAQDVVNAAQNKSPDKSWQPQGSVRNRYWLVENILNAKFRNYRQATYLYHRLGLDEMYKDPNNARTSMAGAISMIEKVRLENPMSMLSDLFLTAKSDEIVSAFSDKQVPPTDKMKVYNAMVSLDAANKSTYDKINSNIQNASPENTLKDAQQRDMMMDMNGNGGFKGK